MDVVNAEKSIHSLEIVLMRYFLLLCVCVWALSTPITLITFNGNSKFELDPWLCVLLCSQLFIYMLFYIVYMIVVCARSSMVFFNVWSILSSKAKKIEILMNQIKSTKRLTIDNFTRNIQTHIRFYCASTSQSLEEEEEGEKMWTLLKYLRAKIKSSPHLTPRIILLVFSNAPKWK